MKKNPLNPKTADSQEKPWRPQKRLGQHFLSDPKIAAQIIGALAIKKNDVIIEIGPGGGFLTKELVKHPVKVIAVEKDERLAENLRQWAAAAGIKNLEIVNGDALKEIKNQILKIKNAPLNLIDNLKIAGNIPYYITGKLLRIIGDLENKPALAVLTVQKEVAERICARPPKMNLLAAAVQFWAAPKIIGVIPAKHFHPVPKVDSAVIALITRAEPMTAQEKECYYKFIKAAFAQPRKTLLNNLAAGLKIDKARAAEILKKSGLLPSVRPQDINLKTATGLSRVLKICG